MLRDWARGLPPGHSVIVARYHCYSGDFAGSYCGDHMWVSGMGPGAHLNRRLVLGLASHVVRASAIKDGDEGRIERVGDQRDATGVVVPYLRNHPFPIGRRKRIYSNALA